MDYDLPDDRGVLLLGDCLERMKELPDNTLDSIVTDPPYGLSFMGKKWDYDVPDEEIWRECLRVLKPGGHLLAFAGTRTQHRMAVRIEDAGFEIRDMIAWVYGCLSEDTEILIDGRWERYHKAIDKGRALCYIPEHDEYQWQPIQDFVEYDYDDTAFRIFSDRTDQIVSRNHRCLVERGGEYVFRYAETLERQETIPVLEGVPELLRDFSLLHEGTGEQESVLRQGVRAEESRQDKATIRAQGASDNLRELREKGMEAGRVVAESKDPLLQPILSGESGDGPDIDCQQVRPHRHEVSRHGHEERQEPCMERRRDVLPQARELQANQVCPVSDGVSAYGAEGWVCNGTSAVCGSSDGSVPAPVGSGAPSGSRPAEQQPEQLGSVCQQSRSQDLRASRHTRPDLARVEPVHYKGKVWCVRVPSGAFVARRNGKVFVTGNSGFPKSHDVSKAIDKAAGAEREVGPPNKWVHVMGSLPKDETTKVYGRCQTDKRTDDPPATEAAKQWNGWGTALKPALEPITMARKPLIGTVAANVLKHGTGGINVDGCRVCKPDGDESGWSKTGSKAGENRAMSGANYEREPKPDAAGRWPANLIHDGSDEVVGLFPDTGKSTGGGGVKNHIGLPCGERRKGKDYGESTGFGDSGSAARFFYCAKASKKDRNEGCEGMEHADAHNLSSNACGRCGLRVKANGSGQKCECGDARETVKLSRSGNHHPTVKPTALMRYLCRLITPPKGIVLDPFMGSGSTGNAALLEGFSFIGIERDEEYFKIANARISHAS
jgi:DNA modification methylase